MRAPNNAKPFSAAQRLSIEFNSWMCKQVIGKPFRHVHESMEQGCVVKQQKKSKSRFEKPSGVGRKIR